MALNEKVSKKPLKCLYVMDRNNKKNVKFTYFKWCLYLEFVKSSGGGGDGPASDITAAEPVVSVS